MQKIKNKMKTDTKKKENNSLNNEPESKTKWKKLKLKGNVISEDGFGLEGLIGLEVLKSYNTNLVTKYKKKLPAWKEKRELKRKLNESQLQEDKTDEPKSKLPKKKKKKIQSQNLIPVQNNTPGQFVLLKPPTPEEIKESLKNQQLFEDLEGWNGLGIPDAILRALAENGFKSPTEIQLLTLPSAIMGKKDILGAAETGSGKTLAFGIPILAGILELKDKEKKFGVRKIQNIKKNQSNSERENCTPPHEELIEFPTYKKDDSDYSNSEDDENEKIDSGSPLYALILTPTRELALQVKDHIIAVAKYTDIKVAAIFGGLAIAKQERLLKACPEIVVATPGRLWELIEQGNSHLNKIDEISFFVIDETDRMIEKDHFVEIKLLLNRLNTENGNKEIRQNFVFSATLSLVHDLPNYLQKKNIGKKNKILKQTPGMKIHSLIEQLGISQPKIVDITQQNQTAKTLTESRIMTQTDHKDYYLYYFLQRHPGRTIVFCNSIDCVKRLSQLFGYLNCNPLPLHANMIQKQRLKNLERFRENPNGILISTDVAARGLDIPNVQHVIHYQVPRTSENYVHRSGRTARCSKDGLTILIMEPGEVKYYVKLCKTLDRDKDLPIFPISDRHLSSVKQRVDLAREVDKMELKYKRKSTEQGWLKKNAEELEIIIDDFENNESTDDENKLQESKDKLFLINKKQTLAKLLNQQLFPKGFSYKYPTSAGKLESPFNNDNSSDSAVNIMKTAIEDLKELKKKKKKN